MSAPKPQPCNIDPEVVAALDQIRPRLTRAVFLKAVWAYVAEHGQFPETDWILKWAEEPIFVPETMYAEDLTWGEALAYIRYKS
jgi:hypothetical protein